MHSWWMAPPPAPSPDRAPEPNPEPRGGFLLATCQAGAEETVAGRLVRLLPGCTRGAWRRGVVSIRLPPGADPAPADLVRLRDDVVFARTLFRCFGQARWSDDGARTAAVRALVPAARWDVVHCFPRDVRGLTAAEIPDAAGTADARGVLRETFPAARQGEARPGDLVLDCLVDEADRWWLGWHRASDVPSLHPGGFHPRPLPGDKVSRAWLKLDEAIATFGIEFDAGAKACELGASPGGACQRLLEAGLDVVGIDPAPVDPVLAAAPRFTQWRKRARDVPLRDMRGFDWIVADMNIDPTSTLEAVGRVIAAPGSRVTGVIATLKLPDWSRAASLDEWLAAFRGLGFETRARQLSTGGREVCVHARRRRAGGGRSPRQAAGRAGGGAPVSAEDRRRRATRRKDR